MQKYLKSAQVLKLNKAIEHKGVMSAYCGNRLKENCFIPEFKIPRGNLFVRIENGTIVDRG